MANKIIIGIDLGTTNVKAIAMGSSGKLIASVARKLDLSTPKPNYVEQDSEQWWGASAACIKEVLSHSDVKPENIECVSASGQGCGALALDSEGRPVHPAIIWMDFRAREECDRFKQNQDRIFEISGNTLDPVQNIASILWLKSNRAEIYNKTFKFLTATAFLNYKFTGNFIENISDAGLSTIFDMKKNDWSDELADLYGISMDKLPKTARCTDIIGKITGEAYEATGLIKGTPVCAGGEDTSSAALAMGIHREEQAGLSTGTSTNLVLCTEKNIAIKNSLNMPHVIYGQRFLSGNIPTSGNCIQWFSELFDSKEKDDLMAILNTEASCSKIGAGGIHFLPYLAGSAYPVSNPDARGVFSGLSLSSKRGDMVRAIMEGVAFSYRSITEYLEKSGFCINEMRAMGGPTKSDLWNQIVADVCGVPIYLIESLAEAPVGDAMIGGVAVGIFKDFDHAVEKTIRLGSKYEPDPGKRETYRELYNSNKILFNRLYGGN